jgi:hypothetical protein
MKTAPPREQRNRISRIRREVEAGARRIFVPKDELVALLSRVSLDDNFRRDIEFLNATIDE